MILDNPKNKQNTMQKKALNKNLHKTKTGKNDEFYTQFKSGV